MAETNFKAAMKKIKAGWVPNIEAATAKAVIDEMQVLVVLIQYFN